MAYLWEVFLRVPCLFILDSSLTLQSELIAENWLASKFVHLTCILLSLALCLCRRNSIVMVYYIGMLVLDVTVVLYLNILNTMDIYSEAVFTGSLLEVSNAAITLPTVVLSWVFYAFSIYMYANAFNSMKPAIISSLLIPIIIQHNSRSGNPPLLNCACFGLMVLILIDTFLEWAAKFVEYTRFQFRVLVQYLRIYGVFLTVYVHWRRLSIQASLVVYWVIIWNFHHTNLSLFIRPRLALSYLLASVAYSCDSHTRVIAFCYVIYYISKACLTAIKQCFNDDNVFLDEDQQRPTGLRESFGFFLLSMYTNLPNVDASQRMVLIELISLLLISALIRSSFEVVEPYLLALHSAPAQSKKRHAAIITFCGILVVAAVYFGIHLHDLRKRFAFSIPNVITVIQIACALILYSLYMYDSYRAGGWEDLDDYVYYVKGACRTTEFLLIVSVLGYRIFDTSLEWTIFQMIMVGLHLYVNVYLPIRDGWQSISLRRLVDQKLNALPKVGSEEIEGRDDVCAICLDELVAARITPCNHLFHKICLKKWLKIQNKCPLCHASILS